MKSNKEFLFHIRDEIDFIQSVTQTIGFDAFNRDLLLKHGIERSLEIIGEAVKQLSADFKQKNNQVEWKAIAGTRDRLIHHYIGVDHELVWDIIQNKIPELKKYVAALLSSL